MRKDQVTATQAENHDRLVNSRPGFRIGSHQFNKSKVIVWTLSTLTLLIAPTAALAWNTNSNHSVSANTSLPRPASKPTKTSVATVTDDSSAVSSSGPSVSLLAKNDTSSNSSSSAHNTSSTNVTVNNQAIAVPANGTTDQTIVGANGQSTHVIIQNQNSASGSNNTSSTNLQINSSSSSDSSTDTQ